MRDHEQRSQIRIGHAAAVRRRILEGAAFTARALAVELGISPGAAGLLLGEHVERGELREVPTFGRHVEYVPRPRP